VEISVSPSYGQYHLDRLIAENSLRNAEHAEFVIQGPYAGKRDWHCSFDGVVDYALNDRIGSYKYIDVNEPLISKKKSELTS